MNEKLLIVDDEEGIRSSLGEYFTRQGYEISLAEDGIKAFEKIKIDRPDVIILDVQLPYMDGLELCNQVRHFVGQSIGIIMISGVRRDAIDKVLGLELGADVYITKPFETAELSAQVKALLRRLRTQNLPDSTIWDFEDGYLRINFKKRLVETLGKEARLTKLEFDLLKYLFDQHGIPVGRSDLIDAVWGYEAGGDINDGAVNTAVAKLRGKIEPDPANPRYIQSVHGVGYRFKKI
jgi:DNA-binding response OmpR family regulator